MASLFQSISYLLGILLPDPSDYHWLMAGSWVIVLTAAILFTAWCFVHQKEPREQNILADCATFETVELFAEQK